MRPRYQEVFYHEPNTRTIDLLLRLFNGLQGKGYAIEGTEVD